MNPKCEALNIGYFTTSKIHGSQQNRCCFQYITLRAEQKGFVKTLIISLASNQRSHSPIEFIVIVIVMVIEVNLGKLIYVHIFIAFIFVYEVFFREMHGFHDFVFYKELKPV